MKNEHEDDGLGGLDFNAKVKKEELDGEQPDSIQEVHKRTDKAKRGKPVPRTYSLPEPLVRRLERYVFGMKAEGESVQLSEVVAKALDVHLKKLERKMAKAKG